jgi:hypothetical protein
MGDDAFAFGGGGGSGGNNGEIEDNDASAGNDDGGAVESFSEGGDGDGFSGPVMLFVPAAFLPPAHGEADEKPCPDFDGELNSEEKIIRGFFFKFYW